MLFWLMIHPRLGMLAIAIRQHPKGTLKYQKWSRVEVSLNAVEDQIVKILLIEFLMRKLRESRLWLSQKGNGLS